MSSNGFNIVLILLSIGICSALHAATPSGSSSSYSIVTDTLDSGGLQNTSTSYIARGSIGTIAGVGNASSYGVQHGYLAQLNSIIITSPSTVNGAVGVLFSYQITATNNPTSYSINGSVPLPGGLTLDASKGIISGTPSAAGTTTVTIGVTTPNGSAQSALTINIVAAAPAITSALTATAVVGQAFSYTILANGTPPITYSASPLPAGLGQAGVTISGTPLQAGVVNVTLTATNGTATDTKTLVLTVNSAGAPLITSPLTLTAYVGTPITAYTVTASGTGPIAFSQIGLPNALALNGAVISGTPSAITPPGKPVATQLTATNSVGTDTETLLVTVKAAGAPIITSASSATGKAGSPFAYTITATGNPTITFAASSLPSGLTVNSTTGAITGTIAQPGTYAIGLIAQNTIDTDSKVLVVSIAPTGAPPSVLDIIPARNPLRVGTPVSINILATNPLPTYTYTTYVYDANGKQVGSPLSGNPVTFTFPSEGTFYFGAQVGDGFNAPDLSQVFVPFKFQIFPLAPNTAAATANLAASTLVTNPVDGLGITISDSASGVVSLDIADAPKRDSETFATTINARSDTATQPAFPGPLTADKYTKAGIYAVDSLRFTNGTQNGHAKRIIPVGFAETGESSSVIYPRSSTMIITSVKGKLKFPPGSKDTLGGAGTRAAGGGSTLTLACTIPMPGGLNLSMAPSVMVGVGNIIDTINLKSNGSGSGKTVTKFALKFKTDKTKTTKGDEQGKITLTLSSTDLSADGLAFEGITNVATTGKTGVSRNIQVEFVIAGVPYFAYPKVTYTNAKNSGTIASPRNGGL